MFCMGVRRELLKCFLLTLRKTANKVDFVNQVVFMYVILCYLTLSFPGFINNSPYCLP